MKQQHQVFNVVWEDTNLHVVLVLYIENVRRGDVGQRLRAVRYRQLEGKHQRGESLASSNKRYYKIDKILIWVQTNKQVLNFSLCNYLVMRLW